MLFRLLILTILSSIHDLVLLLTNGFALSWWLVSSLPAAPDLDKLSQCGVRGPWYQEWTGGRVTLCWKTLGLLHSYKDFAREGKRTEPFSFSYLFSVALCFLKMSPKSKVSSKLWLSDCLISQEFLNILRRALGFAGFILIWNPEEFNLSQFNRYAQTLWWMCQSKMHQCIISKVIVQLECWLAVNLITIFWAIWSIS